MRIIRPVWLTHSGEKKDFEVYSCHVSPDGKRLVTAAGDGFVRVWATDAIYNASKADNTEHRQLASMSYHTGTIHTVRFSGNGQYLASGADDKLVVIYRLDPHAPPQGSTFGSNEAPQIESWRVFRRLIGHENDVQDLGWSQDSSIMVSVGLDSKVVVWSGYTFEKLKTLVGHQSHVKGITFDPANKYFATASDDRTIKIWRFTPPGPNSTPHDQMNNFQLEKTVGAPFTASPLTTYFRRCSWSPDGAHIAAANAVNGPVSSVAIINRGTWDGDINLIGHEGPTEVCAFSPRLFTENQIESERSATLHTVIACGGQDKALSIWITTRPRPMTIAQDIASKSISDLAWTPDGTTLFAASLDGTIVSIVFESGELGYEMRIDENEKALAKFGAGRRGAGMIEGPEALHLEEQAREGEIRGVEGRMGALMGDHPITSSAEINGAQRVSSATTNGVNGQYDSNEKDASKLSEAAEKSKEDPHAAKLERLKNRVTITKDGKKRIAPLLLSSASGTESSLPKPQLMTANGPASSSSSDQPQGIVDLSKPFDGLPPGGLASLLLGNKRRYAIVDGAEDDYVDKKLALASKDGAIPIVVDTPNGLLPAKATPMPTGQQQTPDFIRPAVSNPALGVSQVRLAVPKLRTIIARSLEKEDSNVLHDINAANDNQKQSLVLEARNPTQVSITGRPQDQEPCRISVTNRGQPVFQDYLPRSALLVTGSKEFWAIATEDSCIYAWTPAGRRLLSALVLESQPVILDCYDSFLLCITAVGMCYVWNIATLSSPHPPVSLAPVLDIALHSLTEHVTKGPAITGARLNSEGRIIVSLTNGEGYAYNPDMYVWQRLSELWWMVGSQYWNSTDSSIGNIKNTATLTDDTSHTSAGVLPWLERSTTNATLARGRARFLQSLVKQLLSREGFEGFESSVSIAHLENRVAAAMMLGAKNDFQVYLYMYAKRIGAEGLKMKVEELLQGVAGTLFEEYGDVAMSPPREMNLPRPADRGWNNVTKYLCGWSREELLKGVILILGKNRDLQRITVAYAKILGLTQEHNGVQDMDFND